MSKECRRGSLRSPGEGQEPVAGLVQEWAEEFDRVGELAEVLDQELEQVQVLDQVRVEELGDWWGQGLVAKSRSVHHYCSPLGAA